MGLVRARRRAAAPRQALGGPRHLGPCPRPVPDGTARPRRRPVAALIATRAGRLAREGRAGLSLLSGRLLALDDQLLLAGRLVAATEMLREERLGGGGVDHLVL